VCHRRIDDDEDRMRIYGASRHPAPENRITSSRLQLLVINIIINLQPTNEDLSCMHYDSSCELVSDLFGPLLRDLAPLAILQGKDRQEYNLNDDHHHHHESMTE
jgi:hypothetical protein